MRVKCDSCERLVFKADYCICGEPLSKANDATLEYKIRSISLYIPDEILNIIYVWFEKYYETEDEMTDEEVALAEKLGFLMRRL